MASKTRRAVLTGFGVISPIGSTPAAFRDALLAGTCGIRHVRAFDASGLPCRIAGEIPDFVAKQVIDKAYRRSLNVMGRTVQLGVAACQFAMQDAGLAKGSVEPTRFGIEFASVMGATELDDFANASKLATNPDGTTIDMVVWGRDGLAEIQPTWMLRYLPNMPACHATILFDIQGPSNTHIAGDVAGLTAFGEALRILQRNAADFMLVGGSDAKIHPVSLSRHNTFGPLTRQIDPPEKAVRPFDRTRSGTVLGEGGVAFGLEELGHAQKRGAKISAEVVGYAAGVDRGRDGAVFSKVIRNALADAGIQPGDVDHVNAHGAGVPHLDEYEARAISGAFGRGVPVFAPLSRFGSMGAASSVMELAGSVVALHSGLLPGTLNHDDPDPACPVHVHTGPPRTVTKPYAVKIASTDLGQCAALVLKQWEGN